MFTAELLIDGHIKEKDIPDAANVQAAERHLFHLMKTFRSTRAVLKRDGASLGEYVYSIVELE